VLFEKRNHLWAGLQEGINHCRLEVLAQLVFQVGARQCHVFDDAGATGQGLQGTQAQPPDHAVAPPKTASFSTTMTFRPCHAAVTAADKPAAPEPTISTSQSMSGSSAGIVQQLRGWIILELIPENIRGRRSRASLAQSGR
jgi:hypothetical protein